MYCRSIGCCLHVVSSVAIHDYFNYNLNWKICEAYYMREYIKITYVDV